MKTTAPFPFLNGLYSTAPGLLPLAKNGLPDNRIFDIDQEFSSYISNKTECRQELDKYLRTKDFSYEAERAICERIAKELARSYPDQFKFEEGNTSKLHSELRNTSVVWNKSEFIGPTHFSSLFDAIANQVQEDLAVCRLEGDHDWLAAIHLCSPNHWDPREKIGRPFPDIHRPVPAMERTVGQYKPMIQSVIHKGPFARYAWGIDTDNKLNHHPAGPNKRTAPSGNYFIRMERQHLVGVPEVSAFLFTIRTYFHEVNALAPDERKALASAIRSMTPESLVYKRMSDYSAMLLESLDAN